MGVPLTQQQGSSFPLLHPTPEERTGPKEIFQALWKVLPVAGVWEGLFILPSWAGSRDVVPEEAGVTTSCPESHMPHVLPEQQHLDAVQGKHPSPAESPPT